MCVYGRKKTTKNPIFWRDDKLEHIEYNTMSLKTKMAAIFEVMKFELFRSTIH
jgi:hypothetical protein